jgi:hypothetical protein
MMAPLRCLRHLSHGERSDRSCDPGEGLWPNEKPYPLTPTLSPWEREQTELEAGVSFPLKSANRALPEGTGL